MPTPKVRYTVAIYFKNGEHLYSETLLPTKEGMDFGYKRKKEFLRESSRNRVIWHAIFEDESLNKKVPSRNLSDYESAN